MPGDGGKSGNFLSDVCFKEWAVTSVSLRQ